LKTGQDSAENNHRCHSVAVVFDYRQDAPRSGTAAEFPHIVAQILRMHKCGLPLQAPLVM
jgi:hypothetical protein